MVPAARAPVRQLGRYRIYEAIASGGMATVYFGRLVGVGGFARTVAIKRLHPHLVQDQDFSLMLLDEARMAGRIRHPNVVSTLDVVAEDGELFLVMDYVHGESLARLTRAVRKEGGRVPLEVGAAIVTEALHGLHAAHEVTSDTGAPLGLVHRDVSPQNIIVGADGVTRVLDFGVAKACDRLQTTRDGHIKGKIAYMAVEQVRGEVVDRRADIYAAGVVLWELLTGKRCFAGADDSATISRILGGQVDRPSLVAADVPPGLEDITMRALAADPSRRFDTARQMAVAIEGAVPLASATKIGEWVEDCAAASLAKRAAIVRLVESGRDEAPTLVEGDGETPDEPATSPPPSSVSVSLPNRPKRMRTAGLLAIVGASVGAVAIALVVRAAVEPQRGTQSTASVTAEPPASPLAAGASAPAPPIASATAIVPAATAIATSLPAASPHKRAPVRRSPTSRSHCDPPYTVDADGVRHYIPDCPLE